MCLCIRSYISLYSGDPLTPGVAALPDLPAGSRKYSPSTAPVLPRVPVVALSFADAAPLLSALGGLPVNSSLFPHSGRNFVCNLRCLPKSDRPTDQKYTRAPRVALHAYICTYEPRR